MFGLLDVDDVGLHAGHVVMEGGGEVREFVFPEVRDVKLHTVHRRVTVHRLS